MARDLNRELAEMLEAQGGFYTLQDILTLIAEGRMQSFAYNDTWVVTQVHEFPRKKVLDIVFVIGDEESLHKLEPQLEEYKILVGADVLSATGRPGWLRKTFPGWKAVSVNFVKV